MKAIILAIFICFSIPLLAQAQQQDRKVTDKGPRPDAVLPVLEKASDASPLRLSRTTRILKVIDQKNLMLGDQTIMELAGIDVPEDYHPKSHDFLESLFEERGKTDVMMYQTAGADVGRVNRMRHQLGHLVRKDGHIWVQGALIANGLARAMPTPTNPELADRLFALEQDAITAEKGLWAKDSPHRIHSALEPLDPLGRIVVVEGMVKTVSMLSNTTYLNFGDDWRKDFTIGVPTAIRQKMSRQNIDLFKIQGQKVRVRGWVREYNGPYIELEDPVLLQRTESKDAKGP
jgi:endonuclease YncB( thermonuclease family)